MNPHYAYSCKHVVGGVFTRRDDIRMSVKVPGPLNIYRRPGSILAQPLGGPLGPVFDFNIKIATNDTLCPF